MIPRHFNVSESAVYGEHSTGIGPDSHLKANLDMADVSADRVPDASYADV